MKTSNAMKKHTVVLYDENWHGHHPTYLRIITKIYLNLGYDVWLFCQQCEQIQNWLIHNKVSRSEKVTGVNIKPVKLKSIFPFSLFFHGLINWIYALKQIKRMEKKQKIKPDFIFFLKLDDFNMGVIPGLFLDLLFAYNWSGLYIHLTFPEKFKLPLLRRYICQPFSIFSSKKCKLVATFQEDHVKKLQTCIKTSVVEFPDITDEARPVEDGLANIIFSKAAGRTIVGLIGGIDRRKGVFDLLEVAKQTINEDFFFIIVGEINLLESDVDLQNLKLLAKHENEYKNCFFYFERIDGEGEFNSLINISDIIFAVYKQFAFSSNMMTKAALFQKPILVSSGSLMEQRIKKYRTGLSCRESSIDDIIAAIRKLKSEKLSHPMYDDYCKRHSQKQLKIVTENIISESCN